MSEYVTWEPAAPRDARRSPWVSLGSITGQGKGGAQVQRPTLCGRGHVFTHRRPWYTHRAWLGTHTGESCPPEASASGTEMLVTTRATVTRDRRPRAESTDWEKHPTPNMVSRGVRWTRSLLEAWAWKKPSEKPFSEPRVYLNAICIQSPRQKLLVQKGRLGTRQSPHILFSCRTRELAPTKSSAVTLESALVNVRNVFLKSDEDCKLDCVA